MKDWGQWRKDLATLELVNRLMSMVASVARQESRKDTVSTLRLSVPTRATVERSSIVHFSPNNSIRRLENQRSLINPIGRPSGVEYLQGIELILVEDLPQGKRQSAVKILYAHKRPN